MEGDGNLRTRRSSVAQMRRGSGTDSVASYEHLLGSNCYINEPMSLSIGNDSSCQKAVQCSYINIHWLKSRVAVLMELLVLP